MNKNLSCAQVAALINFYIENKLNDRVREYVDIHLSKCPHCKAKIQEMKALINKYNNTPRQDKSMQKPDYKLVDNISAYADNELDSKENIKIKKLTISNPTARQELENIYKFKKVLNSAYNRTKNNSKFDYSKDVITRMQDGYDYSTTYFYKLAVVFAMLLITIISGFIYLYFG